MIQQARIPDEKTEVIFSTNLSTDLESWQHSVGRLLNETSVSRLMRFLTIKGVVRNSFCPLSTMTRTSRKPIMYLDKFATCQPTYPVNLKHPTQDRQTMRISFSLYIWGSLSWNSIVQDVKSLTVPVFFSREFSIEWSIRPLAFCFLFQSFILVKFEQGTFRSNIQRYCFNFILPVLGGDMLRGWAAKYLMSFLSEVILILETII